MGFYLAADATQRVNSLRREEFFTTTVPEIAREMELLGITPEELIDRLRPQLKS